jgi:hypothetical protein
MDMKNVIHFPKYSPKIKILKCKELTNSKYSFPQTHPYTNMDVLLDGNGGSHVGYYLGLGPTSLEASRCISGCQGKCDEVRCVI